jgi:trimethylamine:corrinoid methyltransferase-like protein
MLVKTWGTSEVLKTAQIEEIYGKALRVLKEVGVKIENKWLVDWFVSTGARVKEPLVVTFPEYIIVDMVSDADPFDWEKTPELSFSAGANPQYYMAAGTDDVCEHAGRYWQPNGRPVRACLGS